MDAEASITCPGRPNDSNTGPAAMPCGTGASGLEARAAVPGTPGAHRDPVM